MQWQFWAIKDGLGQAFGTHFEHTFTIKMLLI